MCLVFRVLLKTTPLFDKKGTVWTLKMHDVKPKLHHKSQRQQEKERAQWEAKGQNIEC